jgi:HNH endonuclease
MEPNMYSMPEPVGLNRLAAVVEELAAEDLGRLPDGVAATRVLVLRRLLDRLEGQWLRELAAVDGRGAAGAEGGWVGPLPVETARRLACDAAVTRMLVTRHPQQPATHADGDGHHPIGADRTGFPHPDSHIGDLAGRLRAATTLLPPVLGGAPTQPLEVGRATRVVSPAQRTALAVRDGGCRYPGCDRPPAWCDAHHLRHWLHGGATDLANLVLLCRAHHRAVHEGGQRLHPPHRRQPTAA